MTPLTVAASAALCAAYGTWTLTGLERRARAHRTTDPAGDRNLELWLLGNPIPSHMVPLLQLLSAVLVAALGMITTANIVIALLLATLGWTIPTGILSSLAAKAWAKADDEAHTLANVLQFALPVQGNPYFALRHSLPDLDPPFKGWLEQVVAGEIAGQPLEEGLADLGVRLRHQELQLLAAILRSDRRSAPSHQLLTELLPAWTQRVRSASERRGTLALAQAVSNLMIWGPMGLFLALDWLTPAGTVFHGTLIGQAVATAGMAVMVAAAHVTRSTLARERRLQTQ